MSGPKQKTTEDGKITKVTKLNKKDKDKLKQEHAEKEKREHGMARPP